MNYKEDIYTPRLNEGVEYQDFVCMELHRQGIVLQNIQSQKYQLKRENLLGMEIKFDRRFQETGNLYIETHEKSNPDNPRFVVSGIYRDDDSWLFALGNYIEFFIFSKSYLKLIEAQIDHHHKKKMWLEIKRKDNSTSRGFVLPKSYALKWSARHIVWSEVG